MRRLLLCLLLLLPSGHLTAQEDAFDGLSRSRTSAGSSGRGAAEARSGAGGDLIEGGRRVGGTVAGARVGFRMGHDNLAFANLSGAVSLGGMSGNCYAMSVVAKLFFERATFEPGEATGFSLDDLAAALASGARFSVRGYASLHELSHEPGFTERDAFEHVARQRGLIPGGAAPLAPKRQMVAQLMQTVSTIHFLHYMQYQAGHFLEAVLRSQMAGTQAVQDVNKRELDELAGQLDGGKTGIFLMLDTRAVYGHVVLATRMTRTAQFDYVEVYDSNVQYGGETRPSVLKVARSGLAEGYFRREADGSLTPHAIYDGDGFFADKQKLALILLPDESLKDENARTLSRKIASADVETAYLLAGGSLLTSLTERSPQESTLRDDVRAFVTKVQSIQESLGREPPERITGDSDTAAVNRVLAARSDLAIRAAFPYALPPGISLADTRVVLDPDDPNKAQLATTVQIAKDSPVTGLVTVLQKSAALAEYPRLADWVQRVRENVGPTRIWSNLELTLIKAPMAGGRTKYGLIPFLARSHVVIGDLAPSERIAADHQIEISEAALQGALDVAQGKLGIVDHEYRFEYILIPRSRTPGWLGGWTWLPEVKRHGTIKLESLRVDCAGSETHAARGSLKLRGDVHVFVAVNPFRAGLGANVDAHPVTAQLTMSRDDADPAGHWKPDGRLRADLTVKDGTFMDWVSRGIARLADVAFPFFAGRVNEQIRARLADYSELVQPFRVENVHVSISRASVDMRHGVVDLNKLGRRLFTVQSPVTLVSAAAREDRLILGARYRTD